MHLLNMGPGIYERKNPLIQLLEKYPDADWKWLELHFNPLITLDFIIKNPDKPWYWNLLSTNPSITWDFISKNLDKPWNWCELSRRLPLDIIEKNLDKMDWRGLSGNASITWDFIQKNHDKPWDPELLNLNPVITWDIINTERWSDLGFSRYLNWHVFTENPSITWDIIKNNPDRPWNWNVLGSFTLTWDIVESNQVPWNWYRLSRNPSITWGDIAKNLDKPWDWTELSLRIDWCDIAESLTWDTIPPWDWWCVCCKKITNLMSAFEILKGTDRDQIWFAISANPNITMKFIEDNLDRIDFGALSSNLNIK